MASKKQEIRKQLKKKEAKELEELGLNPNAEIVDLNDDLGEDVVVETFDDVVKKPSPFVIGKADAFGGVIIAAGEFPALACFVPTVDVLALQFALIRINHFATHRFHITHIGLYAYLAHRHTLARQLIVE